MPKQRLRIATCVQISIMQPTALAYSECHVAVKFIIIAKETKWFDDATMDIIYKQRIFAEYHTIFYGEMYASYKVISQYALLIMMIYRTRSFYALTIKSCISPSALINEVASISPSFMICLPLRL